MEERPCPYCDSPTSERWYDKNGIYSGRACKSCKNQLPGQGEMWDYDDSDENLESDSPEFYEDN